LGAPVFGGIRRLASFHHIHLPAYKPGCSGRLGSAYPNIGDLEISELPLEGDVREFKETGLPARTRSGRDG
jgi:hypothetical protein